MIKKRLKALRLLAVAMSAAMVLNNTGMTVLAADNGFIDKNTEDIVVYQDIDGENDSDEIDEIEDDIIDGEDSEDEASDEDEENPDDSNDNTEEDSEDETDEESEIDDGDSEDNESDDESEDSQDENGEEEDFDESIDVLSTCPLGINNNGLDGLYIDINAWPYTYYQTRPAGNTAYTNVGCAWFAAARYHEMTGKECSISTGKSWWNKAQRLGYSRGQEPKAKALACWYKYVDEDTELNHVAVIEKVDGNNILISEGGTSAYSDADHGYCTIRWTTLAQLKKSNKRGDFLGFIYLNDTDTTPPVISNVSVSDISESGYTVTCKVTDNLGVQKVAFPTWTVNNDQDDLFPYWWETALGTINSDGTVTYRVNTSEHNGETNCTYVTHIYAYDTVGNETSVSNEQYPALCVWVQNTGLPIDAAHFPDANFRKEISRDVHDKNQDGYLSDQEIRSLKYLTLDSCEDYTGIEYFTSLIYLTVTGNSKSLRLSNISLDSIGIGESNTITNIETVELTGLNVQSISIEPVNITNLIIKNCEIKSIFNDLGEPYTGTIDYVDIENNSLIFVYFKNSHINRIDFKNNPNVARMTVGGKNLKEIDISDSPYIVEVVNNSEPTQFTDMGVEWLEWKIGNNWAQFTKDTKVIIGNIEGKVEISGTKQYGKTLTAKVSDCNATNLKYQWKHGNNNISGATSSTYKLVKDDIGQKISCVVTDADGKYSGSIKSSATSAIAKADGPAAPTGLKGVAATKKGAADGKITGVKTTMEYSTKSDFSSNVKACTSTTITGLKAGTYYVRIKETDTAKAGSAATVKVPDGLQEITGTVTISGTKQFGKTLTAKVTDSNASSFKYQWMRGSTNISGANASTYKLVKADIGQKISCVVTDADGKFSGSIKSAATGAIAKANGPAAPTGLKGVATTKKGAADGKITGVKTTMEYSTKSDFSSNVKACTSTTITGLKAGTYYVRIKETDTTKAGNAATVKVNDGPNNDVTVIFKDVEAGAWYVNAIQFVYDRGIMSGTGTGDTFEPNGTLTRGQFVTVLYSMDGKPQVAYRPVFTDVAESAYYARPAIWALDTGITAGTGNGKFSPNANITREQLAIMLYKYAEHKDYDLTIKGNALNGFTDKDKVSSYAQEAMKWAVTQGIISGKGDKLDPQGKATRAECAAMIMRLLQKNE